MVDPTNSIIQDLDKSIENAESKKEHRKTMIKSLKGKIKYCICSMFSMKFNFRENNNS